MRIGCYPKCDGKCKTESKFYLKDRMGLKFRVIPNQLQATTNIYNAKTLSIDYSDLDIDCARIDILDETVPEINNIINAVKSGTRFTGSDYTSGHIGRNV